MLAGSGLTFVAVGQEVSPGEDVVPVEPVQRQRGIFLHPPGERAHGYNEPLRHVRSDQRN